MADRITLSRAKGWRKPEGAIVVARPSIWGNPWGIGDPGTIDLVLGSVATRYLTAAPIDQARAVNLYSNWLAGNPILPTALPPDGQLRQHAVTWMRDHLHARRMQILANLDQLRGHDLCCWCKPGPATPMCC